MDSEAQPVHMGEGQGMSCWAGGHRGACPSPQGSWGPSNPDPRALLGLCYPPWGSATILCSPEPNPCFPKRLIPTSTPDFCWALGALRAPPDPPGCFSWQTTNPSKLLHH